MSYIYIYTSHDLFQELPNGEEWSIETGKAFMQSIAKKTQEANEKLEQVKTTLKVREI